MSFYPKTKEAKKSVAVAMARVRFIIKKYRMNLQDFLKKYLPNYYSDDRVASLNDLHALIESGSGGVYFYAFYELQDELFSEALENSKIL